MSLVEGMNELEANDTVVIVFIAETDTNYVRRITSNIKARFSAHVNICMHIINSKTDLINIVVHLNCFLINIL